MKDYREEDIEYVRKEAETLYESMFSDTEVLDSKKQVYAMIFNNIKMIFGCQIGGIENLEISKDEIKKIIKDVVDNNKRKLNYKKNL